MFQDLLLQKWETDEGMTDIKNLKIISKLVDVIVVIKEMLLVLQSIVMQIRLSHLLE